MQPAAPVEIGERRGLPVVRPAQGSRRRDRFYFGRHLLTPHEHRLLTLLLNHAGQIVTKERMIEAIYGDDANGGPLDARGVINAHLFDLRRKLAGSSWRIATHWAHGYRAERIAPAGDA